MSSAVRAGVGLWCTALLGCTEPTRKPELGPPPVVDEDPTRNPTDPLWLQPADAVVDAVVIVSIDGLAPGALESLIEAGRLPTFARLQREGAWTHNARTDPYETRTVPNHVGMITGRPTYPVEGALPTLHHGYTFNGGTSGHDLHSWGNESLEYVPSIFDIAHDRGMRTGLFASKSKFGVLIRSYDDEHGALDEDGTSSGRNKLDVAVVEVDTEALVDAFITAWQQDPLQLSLLHLRDPDGAGHAYGWGSEQWQEATVGTDQQLGRLLDAFEAGPEGRRIRMMITADHGGAGLSHGDANDPNNYVIPMYVWGAGVPRADLYDALGDSRVDPGTTWVELSGRNQPVRNMDTANLSLRWLGLALLDVRPLAPAALHVDPWPQ